jgi:hypothetical protein
LNFRVVRDGPLIIGFVIIGFVLGARAAAAQDAGYVTVGGFADIKRFGTTNGPYYYSTPDQKLSLDGTGAGGSVRVGTLLIPHLSLELSIDVGASTKGNLPDPYRLLAIPQLIRTPQLKTSTTFAAVSTIVGFHPAPHGRVRLGYLGGLSFVRGTYKSDYPSYGVPVPLFTVGSPTGVGSAPVPVAFPPPTVTVSTLTQRDNKLGVVLGFEAAIDLTKHLAVVPDIRALTFSAPNAGPRIFLIRPGVSVRWSF